MYSTRGRRSHPLPMSPCRMHYDSDDEGRGVVRNPLVCALHAMRMHTCNPLVCASHAMRMRACSPLACALHAMHMCACTSLASALHATRVALSVRRTATPEGCIHAWHAIQPQSVTITLLACACACTLPR